MQAQSIEICYEKNVGGSQRLLIAYRENLSVPIHSFYQNSEFYFLFTKSFVLDLPVYAHAIDYTLSQNVQQLKVVIDTPTNIKIFQNWFRDNLANRLVCVAIIDEDNNIEVLNNLQVSDFNKTRTANRNNPRTIELNFVPAKIKAENIADSWKKIIDSVIAQVSQFSSSTQSFTDIIINLFTFCDPALFYFGYASTNDVSQIIYQGTRSAKILSLANGIYYFFAVHKTLNKYYDSIKITINNGNATFDDTTIIVSITDAFVSDAITPDSEIYGELSQQ